MRPLHELTGEFQELWLKIIDDEIFEEDLEEILPSLDDELTEKCENGIGLIVNLQSTVDAMKAEETRLKSRRIALEKKIASIKDYYLENLREIGKKKVLTKLGTMTVAKAGGKLPLKIDDETAVPQEFINQRTVFEIDKEKLRTALENGVNVKGAHLEQRGVYLKIS